jgi:hypothetical protein
MASWAEEREEGEGFQFAAVRCMHGGVAADYAVAGGGVAHSDLGACWMVCEGDGVESEVLWGGKIGFWIISNIVLIVHC